MNNNFNFAGFNAESAREEAFDVYNDGFGSEVSHDDGFMHVSHNGVRYSFDIGQEVSHAQYNRQANQILARLGVDGIVSGNNN